MPRIACYNFLILLNAKMSNLKPVIRFKALRQKEGLTQLEMSQLLGVTENTYANWENGHKTVEIVERVVKLCKIFKCSVEDLLSYEESR